MLLDVFGSGGLGWFPSSLKTGKEGSESERLLWLGRGGGVCGGDVEEIYGGGGGVMRRGGVRVGRG